MSAILLILVISLICNNAIAKDQYVGKGNLILDDLEVEWFMKYMSPPAGQSPLIFMVAQEDGKSIWSFYYYCPEGSCKETNKNEKGRLGIAARKKGVRKEQTPRGAALAHKEARGAGATQTTRGCDGDFSTISYAPADVGNRKNSV